jgi:hypothetical protein
MTQSSDYVPATHPSLPDVRSCDAWLASALLADSRQACAAYLELLEELANAPPPHASYLAILERLRPGMHAAIAEHTKKFAAKPLPLAHAEAFAFKQVCNLWLVQFRGYRLLLRSALKGLHPELDADIPLLAARSIGCAAELIATQALARRDVAAASWQRLHSMYALAEARGIAQEIIGDPARRECCESVYSRVLLLLLAGPHGMSARELQWARRWIPRWAHRVRIGPAPARAGAHAVALEGDAGAAWRPIGELAPDIRYLDTASIGRSLRKRMQQLADGAAPAALGLGRDSVQPAAGELLAALNRRWCTGPAMRRFPRRSPGQPGLEAEVAIGLAGAHFSVSGKPFTDGTNIWDYSRNDADHIHIFRHDLGARNTPARESVEPPIEQWEMLDESADGFRLRRSGPGDRVTHRQMVALRPHGARLFILSEVRWLAQQADQSLTIGCCALPGQARACAVRNIGADPARPAPFAQGFVLSAGSAAGLPASLVLPPGWHQRDRMLDLRLNDGTVRISLGGLLGRGFDYERVEFAAAN